MNGLMPPIARNAIREFGMNDFTREELVDIHDCLYYENKGSEEKYYSKLLNKINSMIENYCEHELENICCQCTMEQIVCKKCERDMGDLKERYEQ